MKFRNEKHRETFTEAIEGVFLKNYALLAALYVLTADCFLWKKAQPYICRNRIDFERFQLLKSTENGYTLFCAAKDLYTSTKYLSIADLADSRIVPPKLFEVICSAMEIRRVGVSSVYSEQIDQPKGVM